MFSRRTAVSSIAPGIGLMVTAPVSAATGGAAATGPGSLSGYWFNAEFKPSARFPPQDQVLRTSEGELPPMQPWAAELQRQRLAAAEQGKPFASTKSRCLPAGVPQSMTGPKTEGIQIVEQPGEVFILVEEWNNFRVVRLDAKHQEDVEPSYWGDSIGHWEGDTLVVETIGLTNDETLDMNGMPHSDALKVTERYRRAGPEKLALEITIDDPKAFTRVWTTRTSFNLAEKGRTIQEFICTNNRNKAVDGTTSVQLPGAGR